MKEIDIISKDKLKHYEKGVYSGSHKGMRFFICSTKIEEEELCLQLFIWPEPYCMEKTDPKLRDSYQFPFTEEGLVELEEKLNSCYNEKQAFYHERADISTLIM